MTSEEKQQKIDALVRELAELVKDDQEAHQYLDELAFEFFGYD